MNKTGQTLLLNFLICSFATAQIVSFPGDKSSVKSPDGNYIVCNIEIPVKEGAPNHLLFLKDLKKKTRHKLLAYGRYIDALWSPDSKTVAINDHIGSDLTDCLLFRVARPSEPISIKKEIEYYIEINKHVSGDHHSYITAVSWIDSVSLKLNIQSYGDVDPDGFDSTYTYDMREGFRSIKR